MRQKKDQDPVNLADLGQFDYGLIGASLSHSKSQEIHEAFGYYSYRLVNIPAQDLEAFMKQRSFKGINVTIPYKETVMDYLDYVDPRAQEIGAVNTIVNQNGHLLGYNTDYLGFAHSLKAYRIHLKGKKVMVLGSGGASKMVQAYAKDQSAQEIIVISRSGPKDYQMLDQFQDVDIIINATPVGMYPHNLESKIDLANFQHLDSVIDLIYNPLKTKLLLEAKEKGVKIMSGLLMLVAQAFYACQIFTDQKLDKALLDQVYSKVKKDLANIALIGMPASGKTTMAQLLGQKTGRPVRDIDQLVEERAGLPIPSLFDQYGEDYFRQLESQVLAEVSKEGGQVIATGGGSVLRRANRQMLAQNSLLVYLNRPVDKLDTSKRPLSKDRTSLKKMARSRSPLYEGLADLQVDVVEDKEATLDLIWKGLADNENFSDEWPQY